jgi:hypothetical protein
MINQSGILKGLKDEINETLFFFVESDISIYGYITESTKECFETQNVRFPYILNKTLLSKIKN